MLSTLANKLTSRRVILASQSPRRIEVLKELGFQFDVIPSSFAEDLPKDRFPSPELYVMETAKQKALEVVGREIRSTKSTTYLVIGCDTVVVHEGNILEKPSDEEDAFQMLKKLSGTTHNVYSGVVLYTGALGVENPYLFYEKTQVTFGVLEDDDIRSYIKTGEPMDKAGAYGIQGRARCFIEHLSGCHNNVMGFPVQRFCKELRYLIGENKI